MTSASTAPHPGFRETPLTQAARWIVPFDTAPTFLFPRPARPARHVNGRKPGPQVRDFDSRQCHRTANTRCAPDLPATQPALLRRFQYSDEIGEDAASALHTGLHSGSINAPKPSPCNQHSSRQATLKSPWWAHHQSKIKLNQLNLKDIKSRQPKRYSLRYSRQKNQTNFESSARRKLFLRGKQCSVPALQPSGRPQP